MQLKQIIKDRILHGIYPLGTNIPAEPQLEQEFQVSKITVRNAINELSQEGYVEKKSGVGTIVLRNTSTSLLSKGKRFTELLVEAGQRMEKKLIAGSRASLAEGSEPYGLFGSSCLRIERLYTLNDQPYIHFIHYITPAIAFTEEAFPEHFSLYDWLEEMDIAPVSFRDRFMVDAAGPDTASLLHIAEGTALLKRVRYAYDVAGRLVECSFGYYHTELHPYLVNYDA